MNNRHKIKSELEKIPALETAAPYGTEYQLWNKTLEGPIRSLFGEEGLKLFKQQESVIILSNDEEWKKQYIGDLAKKKTALVGMLADPGAFKRLKTTERKSKTPSEGFISKFFWGFVVAVIVVVLGGLILHHFFGIG